MYLPTPQQLIDADACEDQRVLWADLFFDGDLASTEQIEWTLGILQSAVDHEVDLRWGFAHGFGDTLPRETALTQPCTACLYAQNVDKEPRDDTRNAVMGSPATAYNYARDVDKGSRDDTRNAVLGSEHYACYYARDVDKEPRDDTRNAVLGSEHYAYLYARNVDKGPRDDTHNAVLGSAKYAY